MAIDCTEPSSQWRLWRAVRTQSCQVCLHIRSSLTKCNATVIWSPVNVYAERTRSAINQSSALALSATVNRLAMEEEAVIQNDQHWHCTCGLKSWLYRNDIQTNSEVKQYIKLHGLTTNDPMNQHTNKRMQGLECKQTTLTNAKFRDNNKQN